MEAEDDRARGLGGACVVELGPALLSWVPCGLAASFAHLAFSSATETRVVN